MQQTGIVEGVEETAHHPRGVAAHGVDPGLWVEADAHLVQLLAHRRVVATLVVGAQLEETGASDLLALEGQRALDSQL